MNWPPLCNTTPLCRCEMCAPDSPGETYTRKHMAWCLARTLARWTRPDREAFLMKQSDVRRAWLVRAIESIQGGKHERAR